MKNRKVIHKCKERIKIESVLQKVGITPTSFVFNDVRSNYRRLKYCFVHLNDKKTKQLRSELRTAFPNNDVVIEDVPQPSVGLAYHGTAIKIYD